ncbi:MAG: HAMP domain-containing histidine kinase [Chloroflexi bacterium]|nr:HAMP domain-containing histidine kinase [Chloroflexota bacterium]
MSIRTRLAVSYGLGVALTILIVGVSVWLQMGTALRGALETTLQTRVDGVLNSLENDGQAGLQEADRGAPGVFVALFAPDGTLTEATADAPPGIRAAGGVLVVDGRRYLLRLQAAPDGTLVESGADLQSIDAAQAALARVLIGVGLAVGVASLGGGWLLAGRALRPVDRLIDDAAAMGPADLSQRLSVPPRMDEIGRLTRTLNGLLERVTESVDRQHLFVAMASHELRTPLAALRAELDLTDRTDASLAEYRQAVRDAQGDVVRLSGLVTSLLELASIQEDAERLERRQVRLRDAVSTVVRAIDPLIRLHRVAIEQDVPDIVVTIDRLRFEQALGHVLDNAITHGSAGNRVTIRCRLADEPEPRSLTVEVLDRGPGLLGQAPDRLFDAFVRGTGAGPGSGLGLATVASAVRAHGGTFGAGDREGGGARFWFTMPDAAETFTGRPARPPGAGVGPR